MLINGFRCDGCAVEHLVDPKLTLNTYLDVLPASWYMVSQAPVAGKRLEPWIFCSVACLRVHPLQLFYKEE